ncbi:MAG: DUF192 domain-containing protein [Gammaproteobacteria bacterium]|nr:DUF192 domain-containing protein [Gammaproteobacteria bacterium]
MRIFTLLAILSYCNLSHGAEMILTLSGKTFIVELAETPDEHATGLMNRTQLAPNHGMLFVYAGPYQVSFWMKNTLLALDILFFDADGRLLETYLDIQPCRQTSCPRYQSHFPIQYALELPAGSVGNFGIHKGDQFKIINHH